MTKEEAEFRAAEATRIRSVYLDMDGVIADFDAGWRRRLGAVAGMQPFIDRYDRLYEGRKRPWRFWEQLSMTDFQFWSQLEDREFWAGLPWTGDGREIYSALCDLFGESNIWLLTAPIPDPECYAGKFEWVRRHLPNMKDRLITTGHKRLLARPDRLLVDDSDDHTVQWSIAGGRAVRIPRPWNSLHALAGSYSALTVPDWFRIAGLAA
jgi:5'(3')-deoxyribonucleotidase